MGVCGDRCVWCWVGVWCCVYVVGVGCVWWVLGVCGGCCVCVWCGVGGVLSE